MIKTMNLIVKETTLVEKLYLLPNTNMDSMGSMMPYVPFTAAINVIELENANEPGIKYYISSPTSYAKGEKLEVTLHTSRLGRFFALEKIMRELNGHVSYLSVKHIQRKS